MGNSGKGCCTVKTWLVFLLNTGYSLSVSRAHQCASFKFWKVWKWAGWNQERNLSGSVAETGARCWEVTGKRDDKFFYDKCSSSIAHEYTLSGEDGWGRTTSFPCFEALERDTFLLWQTPLQVPTATCPREALEQVGELFGRSCCGVTQLPGSWRWQRLKGNFMGARERAERDQPCLGVCGVPQGRCWSQTFRDLFANTSHTEESWRRFMKQREMGNEGTFGWTDLQVSVKGQPGHICAEASSSHYQNTAGETRFHCFSFSSLTSILPFPFFFATPKVNTLCSDCCPDTASQAGFNSNPCSQSSTRWSVKDFQPCSQAGSQRGQGLVHRAMCFLPCSSKWEGMEETDVENAPPTPAARLSEAAKSRFGLFFGVVVMTAQFCCWFWQWGYHVATQTHKAGRKQILVLSLAIFLTISQVKTSQGTLVGFSHAANNNSLEPLAAVGVMTLVISQLLAMTAGRPQVRFCHPKWAEASFISSRGECSLEFALSTAQLPARE